MLERRNPHRLQVDAHLDDLQSEMEAGARTLERIRADACRVDRLTAAQMRQAGITGDLRRQIGELKRCVMQQRSTLQELRGEMRKLRGS